MDALVVTVKEAAASRGRARRTGREGGEDERVAARLAGQDDRIGAEAIERTLEEERALSAVLAVLVDADGREGDKLGQQREKPA